MYVYKRFRVFGRRNKNLYKYYVTESYEQDHYHMKQMLFYSRLPVSTSRFLFTKIPRKKSKEELSFARLL